jgi:hypothetical protein
LNRHSSVECGILRLVKAVFSTALLLLLPFVAHAVPVTGEIRQQALSNAVASARVTLFATNLTYFRETRTSTNGTFRFPYVAVGSYQLGVAALGYEYQERTIVVSNTPSSHYFEIWVETNGGRWTIVGNTEPELLDGSGSGTLLPSGEIFFCHDTEDPIMFDPVSGQKWYPPDSLSAQGCHTTTMNTDGGMFLVGGSMGGNPQDPVVKIAKSYYRNTNVWARHADMATGRWYPGLVRLPDERLLILGGELDGPPRRTNGCEIYNPRLNTWTNTGSFNRATEIPPTVTLYTGEVLKTWRDPELYNIASGTWRPAANMIQPRVGQDNGDHCDHEIVHLPDGRVMVVGIFPANTNTNTRFCEFYNPSNNTWALGPNPRALRNRPETVILPDGRVLAFGGQYSGPAPVPVPLANAGTIPNCTKVCDLYDTVRNGWRPMADLNRFIHYHNVTLLVPDGRVIATGGAGLTANRSFAGDDSSIEAFEPPYLFRGVRPRIDSLSTTELVLGSNFTMRVSFTESLTKLALVSARATTHWVDGGPQRFFYLDFAQAGSEITATLPTDAVQLMPGYYILYALVDDIPSVGQIVRITDAPKLPVLIPHVWLSADSSATAEGPGNALTLPIRSDNPLSAPLRVNYMISGTALNGFDYRRLSNFAVIPNTATSTTIFILPTDDSLSEGTEDITITLLPSPHYVLADPTQLTVQLADNEPPPVPFTLGLAQPSTNTFLMAVSGPATRVPLVQFSADLTNWFHLAPFPNLTGTNYLFEISTGTGDPEPGFFFRGVQ